MTEQKEEKLAEASIDLKPGDASGLLVVFAGDWVIGNRLPAVGTALDQLGSLSSGSLRFDTSRLRDWDSRFVAWVMKLMEAAEKQGLKMEPAGLPEGVQGLIRLARAVPERSGARRGTRSEGLLTRTGNAVYAFLEQARDMLAFLGEVFIALFRLLTGRARFRRSDLLLFIQETGVDALPIVGLISLLVGLILAFIGAIQLAMFGAQVYVANLVGLGMTREMGAMMAAIIMAGRTGASFSAQLGTMQVNEEIDALKTFGFPPMEFLVLPRMLALILMMPLLVIYADTLGILGGMMVGIGLFDISPLQYMEQTRSSISLTDIGVGVFKGVVFGVLIAVAGCMKGIQCGRSASAVGEATTSAVVLGIVAIIVSDALMTLITNALGV